MPREFITLNDLDRTHRRITNVQSALAMCVGANQLFGPWGRWYPNFEHSSRFLILLKLADTMQRTGEVIQLDYLDNRKARDMDLLRLRAVLK